MSRASWVAAKSAANLRTEASSARSSGARLTAAPGTGAADAIESLGPLGLVPAGQDDLGPGPGQGQGRLETEAAVGSGHHRGAVGQGSDVVCGPSSHHRGPYAGPEDGSTPPWPRWANEVSSGG